MKIPTLLRFAYFEVDLQGCRHHTIHEWMDSWLLSVTTSNLHQNRRKTCRIWTKHKNNLVFLLYCNRFHVMQYFKFYMFFMLSSGIQLVQLIIPLLAWQVLRVRHCMWRNYSRFCNYLIWTHLDPTTVHLDLEIKYFINDGHFPVSLVVLQRFILEIQLDWWLNRRRCYD